MAIDAGMAVAFVAAMATALVQEVPHECLGIALFALVLAHIIVHRRWFTRLVRGRYDAVRVLQLAAVLGLLVCFAGQVASSIAISEYVLWWLPAVAYFGAWSFAALELPAYLSGQVEFAFVDREAPLALAFAQWASVGVLVAGCSTAWRACCAGAANRKVERHGKETGDDNAERLLEGGGGVRDGGGMLHRAGSMR